MTPQTPDWPAVLARLDKLERQNRRLKQAGAVVLVLAAALLLMGQASPNRTVEANEFVLKNANGDVFGRWSATAGYVVLEMFDGKGKGRVSLGNVPLGPPVQ